MGRSKRGKKPRKPTKDEEDVSEDEQPNPESDDFFHDSVDKFNMNREKIMLDAEADESGGDDSIEEVEDVMGLNLPDSDEEEDDDGEEGDDDDDDGDDDDSDQEMELPDEKSWGKKKSTYYSTDTAEAELGSDEETLEMEKEEEVEALALQKRLAAGLDEEDFDTANFEIPQVDDTEERSDDEVKKTVVMDLTKLSKEQKLEMLFRESPELFELLDQFKEKLNELVSKISPLMQLSKTGKLPAEGCKYVELKYRLYLNYCINIGFYLVLKSKQTPVKDHPVIERIVQYRNLIKELEPLDKKLESDIELLLANKEKLTETSEDKGEESFSEKSSKPKATKITQKKQVKNTVKPKLSTLLDDSDEGEIEDQDVEPPSKKAKKAKPSKDSVDPLEYYEKIRQEKKKLKEMKNMAARLVHDPELELDDMEENEDVKRAITYQISKNKGLTARKKKEDRNPRVKHRKKYAKAVIKRKSQVRPVTNEIKRYDGEKSGIRAFLTRSVKIK